MNKSRERVLMKVEVDLFSIENEVKSELHNWQLSRDNLLNPQLIYTKYEEKVTSTRKSILTKNQPIFI
jgi:hypothetical protein